MTEETKLSNLKSERGLVELDGFRYWFKYIVAKEGDMCLDTDDPMTHCNGFYAYSTNDPGNGRAFVIMETDDPDVYSTTPVEVKEDRPEVIKKDKLPTRNIPKSAKPAGTFGTSNDPVLINKWKPMMEQHGITDPYKQAWVADMCETHERKEAEDRAKGIAPPTTGADQLRKLVKEKDEADALALKASEEQIRISTSRVRSTTWWGRIINWLKSTFNGKKN
jgi:hypothetical protein